ncbi:zinc metallopeptidase [Priestia filamentosa]|uniref:zinc metallopeptidase n=1 Tax=Priestia filamentosa TaxID=1402861 RepID=UPI00058932D4
MGYLVYFIIIMAVPLLIQMYLRMTYKKYSDVGTSSGITGAEAARKVLDENGLQHVQVEAIGGSLTDHYDPRSKVVRLSEGNYYGTSIAAISVATHECGHAVQDKESYGPLRTRHSLVPVANIGSNLSFILILAGVLFHASGLMLLGVIFFSFSVLFQVVTLPVEFNASSRAVQYMIQLGMIRNNEESGARKVLGAAALTYIAATVVAIAELVRFIYQLTGMNSED